MQSIQYTGVKQCVEKTQNLNIPVVGLIRVLEFNPADGTIKTRY